DRLRLGPRGVLLAGPAPDRDRVRRGRVPGAPGPAGAGSFPAVPPAVAGAAAGAGRVAGGLRLRADRARRGGDMKVVVKVGGSLYDLPGLGARLRAWLERLPSREVLLVPGGGPAADVVRDLDRLHRLGEEAAHWLALRALSVNARFLAALLPGAV